MQSTAPRTGLTFGRLGPVAAWSGAEEVAVGTPPQRPLFGLLGPVAVWSGAEEVDVGTPQQRALLALLLLHRNRVVDLDRIVAALWPRDAPPNAVQVLRSYVSRLRAGALAGDREAALRTG